MASQLNSVNSDFVINLTGTGNELVIQQNGVEKARTVSGSFVDEGSVKTILNASGSAPMYACRAWVNFNGIGTVAIRASGNVSSITDNGVGLYTVNFTTAMVDASYSVSLGSSSANEWTPYMAGLFIKRESKSTTSFSLGGMYLSGTTGTLFDLNEINISIFR